MYTSMLKIITSAQVSSLPVLCTAPVSMAKSPTNHLERLLCLLWNPLQGNLTLLDSEMPVEVILCFQAEPTTKVRHLIITGFPPVPVFIHFHLGIWLNRHAHCGGGGSNKNYTEILKVDFKIPAIFVTSKIVILWPITIPNCCAKQFWTNWVLFCQIFQNAPNFANWAHWVWNRNPPINIPKMTKKHSKSFEYTRIPSTSEYTPTPVH